MELAINIQEYLIDKGIEMDEEAIQEIIDEIARREQNISRELLKWLWMQKNKAMKMND